MVAGLTVGRKKYAEVSDQMAVLLPRAEALREQLLAAIREDVAAFEAVMTAYKLPKDAAGRSDAIQTAMAGAADVPLAVARAALDALKLAGEAASLGNTNATTDAMAGIHMARAAVEVAALNVRINVSSLKDEAQAAEYAGAIEAVVTEARQVGDDLLAQAAVRVGLD
jgi:formiminotetrahydrofolate cyclodeaminase